MERCLSALPKVHGQLLGQSRTHVASTCCYFLDRHFQLIRHAVFSQVTGRSGFERAPRKLLFGVHAEKQNWQLRPQALQVDQDVQDDDVPVLATHMLKRFLCRSCFPKRHSGKCFCQSLFKSPAKNGMIVSNQHPHCEFFSRDLAGERNGQRHSCSCTGHARNFEFSIEQESTLLHPHKPERFAGFSFFWVEAPAIVGNLKNEPIVFSFQACLDPRGMRVARYVGQRLLKDAEDGSRYIRVQRERFSRQCYAATNPSSAFELLSLSFKRSRQTEIIQYLWPKLRGNPTQRANHVVDQLHGRADLGSELGVSFVQPSSDQRKIHLDCCASLTEFIVDLTRDGGALFFPHALETCRKSPQPIERGSELFLSSFALRDLCSQLLVHAGEDCRSLFSAKFEQLFGLSQRLLFLARFGRVAGELRESKQAPLGVAQSSDDYVGPKARPVFADSPAVVFTLSMPHRSGQNMSGLIIHTVFLGVEDGEVPSDDFFRRITFQTLCTGIPTDHVAHRIQLKYGVFPDALNEQAEAFLTFSEGSFCELAIRNIFKSHSQEITGKRKDSHRINSLTYALVAIGNLSQISCLPRAECIQPLARDWRIQELGKISQGSAEEHLSCRPGNLSGGTIGINNSKCLDIGMVFQK